MGWWGMDGRQAPPWAPGLTIVSSPKNASPDPSCWSQWGVSWGWRDTAKLPPKVGMAEGPAADPPCTTRLSPVAQA